MSTATADFGCIDIKLRSSDSGVQSMRDNFRVTQAAAPKSLRQALNTPYRGSSLGRQLAQHLRSRIMLGEFSPGSRMPSETQISIDYDVSRVTVRTAVKLLESQGLVDVRHGSGTFVCDFGTGIKAGIQELRSITETIQEMGFKPSMERRLGKVRLATDHEIGRLDLQFGSTVLDLQRAIFADGEVVAYSYDVIPTTGLTKTAIEQMGQGSVFGVFDTLGIHPARAIAELHAVSSHSIAWGSQQPDQGLFLLLDQVHFDQVGQPFMYSKTYFVEGRFQFVILRTR
jgi:GntR family transcriptional regulator